MIYMLYFAMVWGVVAVFQFPFMLLMAINAKQTQLLILWTVLRQVGNFIGSVLVAPVSTIGFALFYYDLRVRKEAFDLQMMMQAIGADPCARRLRAACPPCLEEMRPERVDWANSLSSEKPAGRSRQFFSRSSLFRCGTAQAAQSAAAVFSGSGLRLTILPQGIGAAENGTGKRRASPRKRCARIANRFPKHGAVDAGGRHYDVPTDLLVSRLEKAERQPELRTQQVEQARDYLDALAAETASLSGQSPPAAGCRPRQARRAFWRALNIAHTRQQNWWEKIRARINEILFNALDRIFRRVGGQTSLGYVLLWLAICAAAILIAYWIFRRWFRAARGEEMALQAAAVPLRSWQEWVFRRARSGRARRLPHGHSLRLLGGHRAPSGSRRAGPRPRKNPARISSRAEQVQAGPAGDACHAATGAFLAHFAV